MGFVGHMWETRTYNDIKNYAGYLVEDQYIVDFSVQGNVGEIDDS